MSKLAFYKKVKLFASLVKIEHTIFALPFALIGYFMAIFSSERPFEWLDFIFIILCLVFARNAAMAFNRWNDRKIDKENLRTKNREIPRGAIRPKSALIFVILNSLLFMAASAFFNNLCFFLSPVALFVVLGYSYTKHFSSLCHVFLGLGLAIAPIGAYISVTGTFEIAPILLSIAVLFWVAGFDIIYALNDEEFDKKNSLHSIPQRFGIKKALLISTIFHLIAITFIFLCGTYLTDVFGISYWIGASVFSVLLIYQHLIIKSYDLSRVNAAFFTTNGVASLLFALITILGALL